MSDDESAIEPPSNEGWTLNPLRPELLNSPSLEIIREDYKSFWDAAIKRTEEEMVQDAVRATQPSSVLPWRIRGPLLALYTALSIGGFWLIYMFAYSLAVDKFNEALRIQLSCTVTAARWCAGRYHP